MSQSIVEKAAFLNVSKALPANSTNQLFGKITKKTQNTPQQLRVMSATYQCKWEFLTPYTPKPFLQSLLEALFCCG